MKVAALAVPLLLIASGCGQNASDSSTTATAPTDIPSATTPAADMPAVGTVALPEFVTKVAMTDMFEIEAAKLAQQRATSAAVKSFARQMTTDHTATSTKLKGILAADAAAPALPTALDQEHLDKLAKLRTASANEFDDMYIDQQTEAHENALNLLRNYAQNGENAQVKAFAAETAPKVAQHLETVRTLDRVGADDVKKS
jgi:putative membrane protein